VFYEGQQHLEKWLQRIEQKVDHLMSATDDVNNAVAVLGPFLADLNTQVQAIAAKLEAGDTVDTSQLNALIEQLPAAQAAVDALAAPPATTPPATTPTAAGGVSE
jgi:ABC-type transporter Mla subunit MlaD